MKEGERRGHVLLNEAARDGLETVAAILRDFGFSGYAADTYGALVALPEATASDLVVRTGIPDSKIYYALQELVDRGLVEVEPGKPKTYRAVPSAEARAGLEALLETRHERDRTALRRLLSLVEPLQAAAASPATDIAYVVKGLPNVVARSQGLIATARREVLLLASDADLYRRLEGDLVQAARKGVRIRLALPDGAVDEGLGRVAEVRTIVCTCFVLVVDGTQMLSVTRTEDGDGYGITSTDETLVRLGTDYWTSPRCCVVP